MGLDGQADWPVPPFGLPFEPVRLFLVDSAQLLIISYGDPPTTLIGHVAAMKTAAFPTSKHKYCQPFAHGVLKQLVNIVNTVFLQRVASCTDADL